MKNSADLTVMLDNRRNVMRYVMMTIFGCIVLTACDPDVLKNDAADVVIQVANIKAISGQDSKEHDMFLLSDVYPVFNDNVVMTLKVLQKSQRSTSSYLERVTLEQYDIRYVRLDGNNIEGLDVPYAISGRLTETISIGQEVEIAQVLVRHQAKMEPPLKNLRYDYLTHAGGRQLLKVDAIITIYGRTGVGDVVKAEANIMINFADYADEE